MIIKKNIINLKKGKPKLKGVLQNFIILLKEKNTERFILDQKNTEKYKKNIYNLKKG